MTRRPLVLVSGAIANKHLNGGEAWVRLNWILGLRRLGCDVCFVEQIRSAVCVDADGAPAPFEQSANLQYFRNITHCFGIEGWSALVCDEGRQVYGLPYDDLRAIAGDADVLINISGHLTLEPIRRRIRRSAYIDLDPGFTQFWHAQGLDEAQVAGHDFYFTVGENIGTATCSIPTGGITWRHKRRFVVLAEWPVRCSEDTTRLTTVAAWRGSFGTVTHAGRTFGSKVHEFRKLITLPRHASQTFEIALSIHPADQADLDALTRHGWRVVDPGEVARDPLRYREYLQESGGEFSAAQGVYVETASGWLSDRTVRYLAAGKPALVQDTGFGRNYPVGKGLVPFRTLEEAVAGAADIAQNYDAHARAARRLAETYFDSDKVLPDLLDQMGMEI